MTTYEDLFQRNFGVLSAAEQGRLREARALVVGCGGIGGTEALCLARSGLGRFTLIDFDGYEPSNMNRQMGCLADTLGRNKAEVTAELIAKINPEASVRVLGEKLPFERLELLVAEADVVFPAADDFAYSVITARLARRAGVPCVLAVPSGLWATVTTFLPGAVPLEALFGLPPELDYEALAPLFTAMPYRLASYFYVLAGKWTSEHHRRFVSGEAPLAQLCPVVWMAAAAAALEALKLLSGKGRSIVSPDFLWIGDRGAEVKRLGRPNLHTLAVAHRRLMWRLLQSPARPAVVKGAELWWSWMRSRLRE